jgi:hypothetical protein
VHFCARRLASGAGGLECRFGISGDVFAGNRSLGRREEIQPQMNTDRKTKVLSAFICVHLWLEFDFSQIPCGRGPDRSPIPVRMKGKGLQGRAK